VKLSAEEATILCLGIFEDTGSFTFASTTEKDFLAAAYLVSMGANLNTISDLITREITPKQIGLLNDMIEGAVRYHINGVEIVVSTAISDEYIPDYAFLVHKLMRIQNLDVLFAMAGMSNKVYIVGRSRVPEVDVAAILKTFGGGGHPYAASVSLKDMTLVQAQHELLYLLYQKVQSTHHARDLMSSPAKSADAEISCKEAGELLTRYNINALLVTAKVKDRYRLVGFITRQVLEKALYHGLGDVSIGEYMTSEIAVVTPDSDVFEIQEKIIENKQRVLPVVEDEEIKGVITRTDLLNHLANRYQFISKKVGPDPIRDPVKARERNIKKFLSERHTPEIMAILRTIGGVAEGLKVNAYVIGGFVRDLFLFRVNEDLDIVVEGDGIELARKYARLVGGRVHAHKKFGTAVVTLPNSFKIDVATARMEYYRYPADLPTVEMSSLKLDLFRRDFTINTLAIQLNVDRFGTLIDFFLGQKDIKEKTVRVLHNLSFVEDPTRVFRAIRFEQRFGFTIGKLTAGLIKNAVKLDFFKELSGRRIFSELRLLLEEENPSPAIIRLNDYKLLQVIHPALSLDKEMIVQLESAKKVLSWFDLLFLEESYMKWIVYLLTLFRGLDRQTTQEACKRLELSLRNEKLFCDQRFEAQSRLAWLERKMPEKDSGLYRFLSEFKTEMVLFMMAATHDQGVKKAISNYFIRLRYITPMIGGKHLVKMGIEPGPIYREILDALLDAKIDNDVGTLEDERRFVRRFVHRRQAMSV
jgi:tRNA nucleotidyltransferase (CCA-adding enzyme)